jgi:hypothetical protein
MAVHREQFGSESLRASERGMQTKVKLTRLQLWYQDWHG